MAFDTGQGTTQGFSAGIPPAVSVPGHFMRCCSSSWLISHCTM